MDKTLGNQRRDRLVSFLRQSRTPCALQKPQRGLVCLRLITMPQRATVRFCNAWTYYSRSLVRIVQTYFLWAFPLHSLKNKRIDSDVQWLPWLQVQHIRATKEPKFWALTFLCMFWPERPSSCASFLDTSRSGSSRQMTIAQ